MAQTKRRGFLTSGRMYSVWEVASGYGYKNLKDFWIFWQRKGWDFYDILQITSPNP